VTFHALLVTAALCLLPISELRGGLPYALAQGMTPMAAVLFCFVFNVLTVPLVFIFLATLHRVLLPWSFYARIFDRVVGRARRRVATKIDRYGPWGLILFVGIPLPITGAYTGSLGAWVLGLPFRKAFLPIAFGVGVAAVIVTVVYYLVTIYGIEALRIFIKG
jgi:uncharacterized membrane protein